MDGTVVFLRLIRRISYPSFVQLASGFDQLTTVKRAFGRNQTALDFTLRISAVLQTFVFRFVFQHFLRSIVVHNVYLEYFYSFNTVPFPDRGLEN